jgi:tetratricopeptide (TPR) repeat protein
MASIRKLSSEGKWRSAVEKSFAAISKAPSYLPLQTEIADILIQQGQIQEAINKLSLIARLSNLRGESQQAVQMYHRITHIAPLDITYRKELIDLLISQSRTDDAIEQYMQLADVYYHLAELDLSRQTYSFAFQIAQQQTTIKPWAAEILYKMVDIDMQRLDWRKAVLIYEQLCNIDPNDIQAKMQYVNLNFNLGNEKGALQTVKDFITELESSGRRETAINFLEDIVEFQPDRFKLRKKLADLYVRSGNIVKAVEVLDFIANELLDAGNQTSAVSIIQAIIALEPPNVKEYQEALNQLLGK